MNAVVNHVSNQAKGQVRALLGALRADAETMERAIARIPAKLLDGARWKGTTGSARAIAKIVAAMPRPPDLRGGRVVLWRYLSPIDALPAGAGAEARPGVVVKALIAQHRKPGRRAELFGLGATLHSWHRLCDRSNFTIDPAQAMLRAHDALLSLEADSGPEVFALPGGFPLPTPGGFFLARSSYIGARQFPLATCRTWLADDQAHADQEADLEAWERLMDPP